MHMLAMLASELFLKILVSEIMECDTFPYRYVELRDLALETPSNGSPHFISEDAFQYPRRPISKEQLPQPSEGGYSRYVIAFM